MVKMGVGENQQGDLARLSIQFLEIISYYGVGVPYTAVNKADFRAKNEIDINKAFKGFARRHRYLERHLEGVDMVCYLHDIYLEIPKLSFYGKHNTWDCLPLQHLDVSPK